MQIAPVKTAAREHLIALAAKVSVAAQEAPTDEQRAALLEAAGQWIVVVSLLSVGGAPAKVFVVPALEAADEWVAESGYQALPAAKDEVMALLYG